MRYEFKIFIPAKFKEIKPPLWRRALAYFVDILILNFVSYIFISISGISDLKWLAIFSYSFGLIYFWICEALMGRTFGMGFLALRVENAGLLRSFFSSLSKPSPILLLIDMIGYPFGDRFLRMLTRTKVYYLEGIGLIYE